MSDTYPSSKDDIKLSLRHQKKNIAWDKQKIREHRALLKKARRQGKKGSIKFNSTHLEKHKPELKRRIRHLSATKKLAKRR